MKSRSWMFLLFALSLVAASCSADTTVSESTAGAADGSETTEASETGDNATSDPTGAAANDYCEGNTEGTLIWAHEQEPPGLHLNDPNNNLSVTSYIWQVMWDDLYGVTEDIQFYPELLADEGEIIENDDGTATVALTLREGLTWSDGEPLTTEDVQFTFDIIMEDFDPATGGGTFLFISRAGYDQITDLSVDSDTEFSITFDPFFSGYKSLFANIFPAHAFGVGAGAVEVNEAMRTWTNADGEVLPSSGPMVFESWDQGVAMRFTRNDLYHGSTSPDAHNRGAACVSELQVNFVPDTVAQINSLRSGEAHLVFTQPQLEFEEIKNDQNFTVASRPGPIYEHWGLNILANHLSNPAVREAMALALDKSQVVETLYAPVFGDTLSPDGTGNTYWMPNQPMYEDHQGAAGYGLGDAEAARRRLQDAGYVEGADGIFEHPENGRLSLRVGTTGGNALRELQQQIIQAQMSEAGIEITIDNVPGGDYFSERPFSGLNLLSSASGGELGDPNLVDIMQFAWVGGPWPGGQNASYLSGGVVEDDNDDPRGQLGTRMGSATTHSTLEQRNAMQRSTTRERLAATTTSTGTSRPWSSIRTTGCSCSRSRRSRTSSHSRTSS